MCRSSLGPASGTVRTSFLAFGNFCKHFVDRITCAACDLAKDSYFDRQSEYLFGLRVDPATTCTMAWASVPCDSPFVLLGDVFTSYHLVVLVFSYFLRSSQSTG